MRAIARSGGKTVRSGRPTWVRVGLPVALVVVVIAVLVVAKLASGGSKSGPASVAASSDVVSRVTSVPASAFDAVGSGAIKTPPAKITGAALTADGKPRVLYIGAEYCPYCAAERWAMVAALSRFGTFSDLGQTASSAQDVYPSTATLSFHGATYSSSVLSFTGVETTSNTVVNGRYATLDTPTAADEQLVKTLNPQGSIPFVDLGGKYTIIGASYDPQVLQGKTHAEIAQALSDPSSDIAKAVDGTANVITAAICASTDQKPAAVCTSAGVTAAAQKLSQ